MWNLWRSATSCEDTAVSAGQLLDFSASLWYKALPSVTMARMVAWFGANWFTLIQTAGVVGSLLFAGAALRFDAKVRRTEVLLALTDAHREIWAELIHQPGLGRILDARANPYQHAPTSAERHFVLLVILHIAAVRQAIAEGAYCASSGMGEDIRSFLALPIPDFVARSVLPFQDQEFQHYLQNLMK